MGYIRLLGGALPPLSLTPCYHGINRLLGRRGVRTSRAHVGNILGWTQRYAACSLCPFMSLSGQEVFLGHLLLSS